MIVYRVDAGKTAPVETECEALTLGKYDIDGFVVTVGSHRATEGEAWALLMDIALHDARSKWNAWQRASGRYAKTAEHYEAWQQSQKQEG